MAAILNFSKTIKKITCTSPYRGECDSKIWIISDFKLILELTSGGHFEFLVAFLKNHLNIPLLLRMSCWN